MAGSAPLPLDVIETNLTTQVDASEQVLRVVERLAQAARDESDDSANPEIAPELRELLSISEKLRSSANTVAETVVATLDAEAARQDGTG